MEFFTGDQHLCHANAIEYFHRPFPNVEEMNEALVGNWNRTVSDEDEVYILGDFTMRDTEYADRFLARLRGKKYLIRGNHDYFAQPYEGRQLEWVKDYYELQRGGACFILCHYPLADWNRKKHGAYHLHGHAHGDFRYNLRQLAEGTRRYDAGVDANDFTPVARDAILRFFKDTENSVPKNEKGRRKRGSLGNDKGKE